MAFKAVSTVFSVTACSSSTGYRGVSRVPPRSYRQWLKSPARTGTRWLSSDCDANTARERGGLLRPLRYHTFKQPIPYQIGLDLQNDIVEARLKARAAGKGGTGTGDVILLLEHTPTYTTGRRDNSQNPDELHPEEKKVQNVGAEFHITKRGGQVTYHGPGQLVGYPILDLEGMQLPTRCYVDQLQSVLAEVVRSKTGEEVLAPHPDGHVGVFSSPTEKVASIGIHLRHRVTSHGFSLNVTPDPIPWFDLVLACGLADVKAISLHQIMLREAVQSGVIPGGVRLPQWQTTGIDVAAGLAEALGRQMSFLMSDDGDAEVSEELVEIRDLVKRVEEEAARVNRERAWPERPNVADS